MGWVRGIGSPKRDCLVASVRGKTRVGSVVDILAFLLIAGGARIIGHDGKR